MYTRVKSGTTCERVASKAECEQAARQLGLRAYGGGDYVAAEPPYNRLYDYWPPGCFFYNGDSHGNGKTLYFNNHDSDVWQCDSGSRVCICKETETGKWKMEGGPIMTVDEARVVVVGGYINGNYLTTVEIFTLKTETYEYGGETFSGTTGKWTTGRIRLTPLS